ncbi:MAG: flagellar biosynthesis anti-sigma factor FlgM [Gemmatimonadaceae bacterium]|jgi:negative regulator of flagellin synthesis FlgM|nr:flagellar biosynthesis anti-sigma factor FlgM [Gemmatimonadaceae bacterium]MCC6430712.1 flagellar biosynthesis anti-sigma factor FlgM [Gemmatimonadaceae bacterium]
MRINGSIFDPLRPDRATPNGSPAVPRPAEQGGQASGVAKSDSVQISDAGRSLAGRLEREKQDEVDPAKVAELRTKVLTGAYNTLDVVDQVARRIISRGDL